MKRRTRLEWSYLMLKKVLKYAEHHKFQVRVMIICLSLTFFLVYATPQLILIMNAWTNNVISIIKGIKCL